MEAPTKILRWRCGGLCLYEGRGWDVVGDNYVPIINEGHRVISERLPLTLNIFLSTVCQFTDLILHLVYIVHESNGENIAKAVQHVCRIFFFFFFEWGFYALLASKAIFRTMYAGLKRFVKKMYGLSVNTSSLVVRWIRGCHGQFQCSIDSYVTSQQAIKSEIEILHLCL